MTAVFLTPYIIIETVDSQRHRQGLSLSRPAGEIAAAAVWYCLLLSVLRSFYYNLLTATHTHTHTHTHTLSLFCLFTHFFTLQAWQHHHYNDEYKCQGPYHKDWGVGTASWHPSVSGHQLRAGQYSTVDGIRRFSQRIESPLFSSVSLPSLLYIHLLPPLPLFRPSCVLLAVIEH